MTTLGDFFSADFKKDFSEKRGISPGDVLRFHCNFTTPAKEKFMVVVCCQPLLILLINSNIPQFIQDNAHLLACQVDLPKQGHDFLSWDSHINCIEAHAAFNLDDVKDAIAADYGNVLKGRIEDTYIKKIRMAVSLSKRMEKWQKTLIISALSDY
ncbi:hypothetical protein Rahaq_0576 [Rahnella aceris]|uniref:Uncharacterized protein n=1 Tax=Rahnella sp. (strain Y9602) TaxID=2703885 RepID=A0A0H3F5N4_RAHSY|nr:hypothetical protein [Rahnella aceris]ADW72203.1 hypothetical protein Rahaq_0576 [Rahnella aceris]